MTGCLEHLADRKAHLRLKIAFRREACRQAAQRIADPIHRIELWRARLQPWLKLWPVGAAFLFARARAAADKDGKKKSRWRWLPLATQVARFAFTYAGRGG